MRIAVLTPVFLGGFGEYADLGGDLIGGREVYLHTLIENVLEPLASGIVVYQKTGISKRLSEKTFVITVLDLRSSKLDDFDIVIINDLQSIGSKIDCPRLKTKSIAIHHGMSIDPVLTWNTLRIYHEYNDAFHFSAKRLYRPTRILLGDKVADLSLRLLKAPFRAAETPIWRKITAATLNRNSDMVDCIVSVDNDSLKYVPQPKLAKWRVIYNFVDLDVFNPTIPRLEAFDGRTILVPRNLTTSRGVFIIPRLARLLKKWGCQNFRFLIAGEGYLRPFLENEVKKLRLEREVALIGHQDHFAEMPHVYANCDIVLVPSFASEGTSLAVLEGMASEKPVVTTDTGGINDIGVNGEHKLSSPFNVRRIGENIERLMEDENLGRKISKAGYEYVCRNHNIYSWTKKWREVIENLWRN